MLVKQIDMRKALELAAKGQEVLVLIPSDKDQDWEGMVPDTLSRMLDGCLFFRREPAMEVELAGPAEIEPAQLDPPSRKEARMEPEELRKAGKWIPVEEGGIE